MKTGKQYFFIGRSLPALLLLFAAIAAAQNRTAEITGRVRDPTGAAIDGARISVRDVDTGAKHIATSSGAGDYTVPLLEPGTYDATVEHPGFRTLQRSGITLHVGDSVRLDFSLELGQLSQTVDVTEAVPLLRTTDASLGQVIDNTKITSLPLNGRSSFRLVALTPGFIGTPAANGQFGDIPVNTTWDANFSINGGQGYSNEIMIDGAPSTTGFFNQITTMPSVDALVEFKVQSNTMSAEFGRFGGGVINVTTKSGTNSLHGTLFEFLRNSALGANDFFNNLAGSPNPPFRMNQFGGSFGGPVLIPKLYDGKNRTFFFFNYEGTRWRRGAVFTTTVPSPLERQGDFSHTFTNQGQEVLIYDPSSTAPDPAHPGSYLRTAFPGNVIPAARINAISRNIMNYYPMPNTPGNAISGINNFVSNAGGAVNKDQINIRLDHQLSDLQKIFGRASVDNTNLCQPNYYKNIASPTPGTVGCTAFKNGSGTFEYDYTLSPSSILTVRYGFARWFQLRAGLSYGFDQTSLGFPASLVAQEQVSMFPAIAVAGYGGLGNQTALFLNNGNDTHSLLPSLTMIRGRQSIKLGADLRMNRINFFNPNAPAGTYSFTQAFTQGPNPLQSSVSAGDGFASFLLGVPASGSITTDPGVSLQNFYFAGYFQDDIKISNRLTVNLGLRYETESPYTERRNQLVSFDPNLPSPAANSSFPNLTGALHFASPKDRYVYDWDKAGFAPRAGLAYQLSKSTVIRTGAGLFYAPLQISNNAVGFTPSLGFSSTTPMITSVDGNLTPYATLDNPFPSGFVRPTGSSLGAATFLGQGISVWDAHPITPESYQWNLDIQQQLPGSILIDAAYVGNRGVHLAGNREFNALYPSYLSAGSNLLQQINNPFYGLISAGTLAQPSVIREQLLRPFPQFQNVSVINDTAGDSIYNALELKVEKRMSSGLEILVAYTFAKLITDVPWADSAIGGSNGSGSFENWYNLHAERSLSAQDVSQSMTISYNYELPVGKGKSLGSSWRGPAQWFLGGWQINGVTRLSAGTPLALTTSTNNTNSLGGGSRPNTNGSSAALPASRPTANRIAEWFDVSTFTLPASFTFGNVSRTLPDVRSPGAINFDFSMFKNIPLKERLTLQFRSEFFNILNHPNFGLPNTADGDRAFGTISSTALLPRVGQFALKLIF
ncbi:MAG TPA: carboxypeptidase-like regulatory domain-containing protein [Bryobacteraceae bacterium]|nr:carboxypeptidase-like regulatory domain-containing protein [Bryobacteraceae bacterium]